MMYEMKYLIHPIHEEYAGEALLLSPRSFRGAADAEPSFAWSDGRKGVMLSFSSAVRCGSSIQRESDVIPFPFYLINTVLYSG